MPPLKDRFRIAVPVWKQRSGLSYPYFFQDKEKHGVAMAALSSAAIMDNHTPPTPQINGIES